MAAYFTKMKKLKDELRCLAPIPEEKRDMEELINRQDVMDLLMGLNDTYDSVRSQILMMDPLPSLNKTYAILMSVEKQEEIQGVVHNSNPMVFMSAHKLSSNALERRKIDKKALMCDHYKRTGHTKETCFKLHGLPEWYKSAQDKKRKEVKGTYGSLAYTNTTLQISDEGISSATAPMSITSDSLTELIQREIKKAFEKANTPLDHLNMLEVEHSGPEK
ncbi:uncharacterized protein LOC127257304 [Andrographis paniculata]|uniref:uncharacterized protein LOC127257304 n=1 Tax=Andrographis paniculata TaxID=175694 RepID=UPI0021E83412|nr:uncharacterized protein LOC127257304 [Andrographis paniculata]